MAIQLKLAILIFGVYCITLASPERPNTQQYFRVKNCNGILASIRIKILKFFINIRQFIGLRKPIKLDLCDTSTTEATTAATTTTTTTMIPATTTTGTTICMREPALVTLHRFHSIIDIDYILTTSLSDRKPEYVDETSPGLVVASANDCLCGTSFIPMYHSLKPGDHLYTLSQEEVETNRARGYEPQGIAFYCATEPNYCGASLPLHKFVHNTDFFYTTDREADESRAGPYRGIACYIWPS